MCTQGATRGLTPSQHFRHRALRGIPSAFTNAAILLYFNESAPISEAIQVSSSLSFFIVVMFPDLKKCLAASSSCERVDTP